MSEYFAHCPRMLLMQDAMLKSCIRAMRRCLKEVESNDAEPIMSENKDMRFVQLHECLQALACLITEMKDGNVSRSAILYFPSIDARSWERLSMKPLPVSE